MRFLDCEAYLDGILPGLETMPRAYVEKLWAELGTYYFSVNEDPVREAPFLRLGMVRR